jgi:hypothetical protein
LGSIPRACYNFAAVTCSATAGSRSRRQSPGSSRTLSDRERAIRLIRSLPDQSSFEEIIEQLCFRRAVEQGLADARDGHTTPDSRLDRRIAEWLGR